MVRKFTVGELFEAVRKAKTKDGDANQSSFPVSPIGNRL